MKSEEETNEFFTLAVFDPMNTEPFPEEGVEVRVCHENPRQKNLKKATRGPAEPHGVRLAARPDPAGERATEDFETEGECQKRSERAFGEAISGVPRKNLLQECRGHSLVLPVHAGVEPTRGALELGVLADDGGEEITLGELRRPKGRAVVDPKHRSETREEIDETLRPVGKAAEAVFEGDVNKLRTVVFESPSTILAKEEQGVGKTRANHALKTFPETVGITALEIDRGHERGKEFPAGVTQDESPLLDAEDDADDLLGKLEIAGVEGAGDGRGVLEKAQVLVEKFRVRLNPPGRGALGEFRCKRGGGGDKEALEPLV